MLRMNRYVLNIGVVTALAVLGVGCNKKDQEPKSPPGVGQPGGAIPVEVTVVKLGTIESSIPVTGNLQALQDVNLSSKISARVVSIALREGDAVRAGQVVAQLDTTDLAANVRQAQANIVSAEAKLSQAKTNYKIGLVQADQGVLQAKASLAQAQENYLKMKHGPRPQETLQARNSVLSARANVDNSLVTLNRNKVLYQQGAIPKSDLDQAQTNYEVYVAQYNNAKAALDLSVEGNRQEDIAATAAVVRQQETSLRNAIANKKQIALRNDDIIAAQAGVAQAKANLVFVQQQLDNAYIKSPINGIVASRNTEPGQIASPGTVLMRVVNVNTVYYEPTISETDYGQIKTGQSVVVHIDALANRIFQGRVAAVYPATASGNRDFQLRVTVPNQGNVLRPGMFARGSIITSIAHNVPIVPASALISDAAGQGYQPNTSSDMTISANSLNPSRHVVLVGDDNKAVIRHVIVGIANMNQAEIIQGITAGDKIVVVGQRGVQEGSKLAIVNPNQGNAAGLTAETPQAGS